MFILFASLVTNFFLRFVTFSLPYATILPFIGEFLSSADGHKTLVDPFSCVAFALISCDQSLGNQLRVKCFVNTFSPHLRQPQLEGLGFLGGNGLDDTKKLLGVGNIGETAFSVGSFQFQLLTICKQFICSLFIQPFFQNSPISAGMTGIWLICQYPHYIYNRKIPLFFPLAPCSTDGLVLKEL